MLLFEFVGIIGFLSNMRLVFLLIFAQARKHPLEYAALLALVFGTALLWVAEPLYLQFAIDRLLLIKTGAAVDVARVLLFWGLLFVAISITQTAEKFMTWRVQNQTELERSEELYARVLDLDIAFHTHQKSGEVVKLLDEGAEHLGGLQRALLTDLLPSAGSAIAFFFIGLTIQPMLSGVLAAAIVLYFFIVITGTKRTMRAQQKVNRLWIARLGHAYDAIANIFAVKSGAQERHELNRLESIHRRIMTTQMRVNRAWAAVEAINIFMLTRITLTAIGILLYVRDALTLGELYFFQASFFRVLSPLEILSGLLPTWNKQVGKIRLSNELMRAPITVLNGEHPKQLAPVEGAIVFDRVCFSYPEPPPIIDMDALEEMTEHLPLDAVPKPEDERLPRHTIEHPHLTRVEDRHPQPEINGHDGEVLHDVALQIRPGEHLALVGHSGAGKSTIALLLNRFYDVTKGRVSIDGVDLRDLDQKWWRAQIGLVLQENIIFNDSILENIRYARPDASREDVEDAARRAAAEDFIRSLPKGFETLVGERGVKLSGGQRQRVSIARAILKRPSIVILDEATSALDSVTERAVQEGIRELITGRTAVIIAHRLSTVRSVDRIAVLDKGLLIACAPHEELMKTCSVYREMVELQSHGMLAS